MRILASVLVGLLLCGSAWAQTTDDTKNDSGTLVQLNDFGSNDIAYLSIPAQAPLGGIVVIHDKGGLNENTKAIADRLAKAGYIAIAPDLFNGQVSTDPTRDADLSREFSHESGINTVHAAIRFLHESPRFRADRVALIGRGFGAEVALEAALKECDLVSVVLWGGPITIDLKPEALAPLSVPLLGLFDVNDPAFTVPQQEAFCNALENAKKEIEVDALPATGSASVEKKRWKRVVGFLDRTFHAPPKRPVTDFLKSLPFVKKETAPSPTSAN